MNPLVYLWLFFHINNQFHTRGFFMSVFPFKKAAVTLLLLTAAYFSGSGIHYLFSQPTTVLPASSSSEGNWGLSFQEEGVRPVGNATPSELAKYQPTQMKQMKKSFTSPLMPDMKTAICLLFWMP